MQGGLCVFCEKDVPCGADYVRWLAKINGFVGPVCIADRETSDFAPCRPTVGCDPGRFFDSGFASAQNDLDAVRLSS